MGLFTKMTKKIKTIILFSCVLCLVLLNAKGFAVQTTGQMYDFSIMKKDFVLGSIADKIGILKSDLSALENQEVYDLCLLGLDFCVKSYASLGLKEGLGELATCSLALCNPDFFDPLLLDYLGALFNNFPDPDIKCLSIKKTLLLLPFTTDPKVFVNITTLANSYVADNVASPDLSDKVFLSCIDTLGQIGNIPSFRLMFALLKNTPAGSVKNQVATALCLLSIRCPIEAQKILSGNDKKDALLLFQVITANKDTNLPYKAQIAQDLLEAQCKNQAKNSTELLELSKEEIAIQQQAVGFLASCKWTRAADTVTDFLFYAKLQYQNRLITQGQLIKDIQAVVTLNSTKACSVLLSFLDELNNSKRKNIATPQNVVLALVEGLKTLKDKTAFDSLLAVTYLDYDENVKQTAKDALETLKW